MKNLLSLLFILFSCAVICGQNTEPEIILVPYVQNDAQTPQADKALLNKLTRIITKYGVSGGTTDEFSPFILTAHATEINKETTSTAPPMTAVELLVTIYLGNGVDGQLYASTGIEVKGVGNTVDKAYASAFNKINVNDPGIGALIKEGESKIKSYYMDSGAKLIASAEGMVAAGNYPDAYSTLLQIPPVCPQYGEAQKLLAQYTQRENDSFNGDIISKARAEWTASPDEAGADKALAILAGLSNPSEKKRAEADKLMKEIAMRLQRVADAERRAEENAQAQAHERELAAIKGATKVAAAYASRPVYKIYWW